MSVNSGITKTIISKLYDNSGIVQPTSIVVEPPQYWHMSHYITECDVLVNSTVVAKDRCDAEYEMYHIWGDVYLGYTAE